MDGKGDVFPQKTIGNQESHNTAENPKVLKKGQDSPAYGTVGQQGEKEAEIHGDAAELKRKVPPVV